MNRRLLYAVAAALVIPLFLAVSSPAETYIWIGMTDSASVGSNWYCPDTDSNGVPGAADDVSFGAPPGDCRWDITHKVKSLTVETGYAGKIIAASSDGIQVANRVELRGGNFDLAAGALYIDGSFYATGSSTSFSPSSTICLRGGTPATIQLLVPLSVPSLIVDKPATTLTFTSGSQPLDVTTSLLIHQGSLLLGDGNSLRAKTLSVHANATLDLRGSGNKSLLTDQLSLQGMLLANAAAQAVAPYTPSTAFPFTVEQGSQIDISGLTITSGQLRFTGSAAIGRLDNIVFNCFPGSVALQFEVLTPGSYRFDRCVFKGSPAKNIAVPSSLPHQDASIVMSNASGAAAGSAYEQDPNSIVYWSTPTVRGVAPVARSNAAIDWQWANEPDADGYRICQASSGVVLANLPVGTTHFLTAGLPVNTTCAVSLSAYNILGTSTITLTGATLANAPVSGSAIALGGGAVLKADWDPSGNPASTEYLVRCSTDAAYFARASSSPWTRTTSWPFDHLVSGATHYFQVKARNHARVETPFVAIGAAKTGFTLPENFIGTALSTGSIKWSWTDANTGETGYRLSDATGTVIANLPADTTEYVESGLLDNARCTRTVTVYFVAGDSATTAAVARYTLAKLPEPATVTVSSATAHLLTVSWQRGRESSCRVDVSSEPGGTTVASRAVFGAASVNLGGLLPATTYYLTLTAYNAEGAAAAGSVTRTACTLPLAAAIGNPASAPYDISVGRTSGGVTLPVKVEVPQGTVDRAIYIDINLDPLAAPREADPARIIAANAAMANGERCLTDTITEFNMYSSTGDHISGGFDQDVTIRLPYRDENNDGFIDGLVPRAHVSALRMYTLNEAAGRWEPVASTIDTVNHQVVALVRHFSVYTLVIEKTAARTLGELKVYPNPFKPGSRTEGIAFAGLTAHANIKIYTVAGELVFEATDDSGTGTYNWQAVNSAGNRLASGVYIYLITNPNGGETIKGKIAIQR